MIQRVSERFRKDSYLRLWAAVLIPHLIGLAQQADNTLPSTDLADYKQIEVDILQMLIVSLVV